MSDTADRKPALARRRRIPRPYVLLLSVGIVLVLAVLGGLFLLPRLADGYYLDKLLDAPAGQPAPKSAVQWWVRRVRDDPKARARFEQAWRSVRDNDEPFVRLAEVLYYANALDEQPAELRVRYLRLARLSSGSPWERAQAVDSLLLFGDGGGAETAAALRQALDDESAQVAAEAAWVLPAWIRHDWAVEKMADLLDDPRAEVRRRGALACGMAAQLLGDSAAGRAVLPAIRDRLVLMAHQDSDVQARADACWALFRLGWMGRAGLDLVRPGDAPAEVRRMAALLLANGPAGGDGPAPLAIEQALETMIAHDPDELTRQRAGIALAVMAQRSGLPRPPSPATFAALLIRQPWASVQIGVRLAGLTRAADAEMALPGAASRPDEPPASQPARTASVLDALLAYAFEPSRPDPVSEQLALAFGRLAVPPAGQADEAEFQRTRAKALAGLAALYDPSRLTRTTEPDGDADDLAEPPGAAASPRTRLAVAVASARLGQPAGLLELAQQEIPPGHDDSVSPQTMADLACLELARLARENRELASAVTEKARRFARDYAERSQRSGALLIGLLGDAEQGDWMLDRYRRRRVSGEDPLTTVYFQVALLMLGRTEADEPGPAAAVNWLNDPKARTPGIFAALARSGHRQALDELLQLDPPAWASALMDDWHLREHVVRWAPSLIEPIPAADPDLADFLARQASWWYHTQRHRLAFDPQARLWRVK